MTARELIKALECCDLDKRVSIIMGIADERETEIDLLLRDILQVTEHSEVITLQ